jgi:hypothetical protein
MALEQDLSRRPDQLVALDADTYADLAKWNQAVDLDEDLDAPSCP